MRIVGKGLQKLMGREEELTRAVLLEFMKSQGTIEEVKGLVGGDCADDGWSEL